MLNDTLKTVLICLNKQIYIYDLFYYLINDKSFYKFIYLLRMIH